MFHSSAIWSAIHWPAQLEVPETTHRVTNFRLSNPFRRSPGTQKAINFSGTEVYKRLGIWKYVRVGLGSVRWDQVRSCLLSSQMAWGQCSPASSSVWLLQEHCRPGSSLPDCRPPAPPESELVFSYLPKLSLGTVVFWPHCVSYNAPLSITWFLTFLHRTVLYS